MTVALRRALPSDVASIAALHAERIGEGFLASLGGAFLERLYRRIVLSPSAFLVVACDSDHAGVSGFVAGTTRTRSFYGEFLRHDALSAAWAARRQLPAQLGRAVETLRYGGHGPSEERLWPDAELLALAVRPAAQGHGIGRALVVECLAEMRRLGVTEARVTVASDNGRAQHVYTACGFRPATTIEVHRGRASDVLFWP